jgi:hypothetical protein
VEVGQACWYIPATSASVIDLAAAIVDTGEGAVELAPTSMTESAKIHFARAVTTMCLKNVSEHAMRLTCYKCVCRSSTEDDSHAGVKATALNYLAEGWQDRMLDADETAVNLTIGSNSVLSDMFSLSPQHSSRFMKAFRIVKTFQKTLEPADSMKLTLKSGRRTFIKHEIDQAKEDAIGGYTCFYLIKMHGSLGHLKTDTDNINTLAVTLGAAIYKAITFHYTQPYNPLIAVTNNKANTGDFEGPGQDMEQDDDV